MFFILYRQKGGLYVKEIKYLKYWFSIFLILIPLVVIFIIAFLNNQSAYFVSCAGLLALFLFVYYVCNKKITCKNGYTVWQAYFFYLKCEKAAITKKEIDNKEDTVKKLQDITKDYDFAKNFNKKDFLQLYLDGKSVYQNMDHNETGKILNKIIKKVG